MKFPEIIGGIGSLWIFPLFSRIGEDAPPRWRSPWQNIMATHVTMKFAGYRSIAWGIGIHLSSSQINNISVLDWIGSESVCSTWIVLDSDRSFWVWIGLDCVEPIHFILCEGAERMRGFEPDEVQVTA